jgi:hypothetical protein
MIKKYSNISDARNDNKNIVLIWYPFHLGGDRADAWMWMSEKDGEVINYNDKFSLLRDAFRKKERVAIMTLHKDKTTSVRRVVGIAQNNKIYYANKYDLEDESLAS